MTQTLEMVFKNAVGKEVILRLTDPRTGLTLAEAMAVMATIVAKNIFSTTGGDLVEAVTARINSKEIIELA